MSILLVRHGETLLNAARTVQPADTPLGPRGLAQARSIANRLSAGNVRGIVSSDLPRALQTADAIAEACGLPVALEPLLQERNFGDLRGHAYDALGFDPLTFVGAPPGGESASEFRQRVARAFERIRLLRVAAAGDLVVVTHGLVIGALLDAHAHWPQTMTRPERLANTSLTILEPDKPHTVALANCTAHLVGPIEDDPLSLSGG